MSIHKINAVGDIFNCVNKYDIRPQEDDFDFVFQPMLCDKFRPAYKSPSGHFFWEESAWKEGTQYRRRKDGKGDLIVSSFAAKIPQCMLNENQRDEHFSNMKQALKGNKCPIMAPDWLYLTLYDSVAVVFEKLITSKFCIEGMKMGWFPIFALKHCILQVESKFGLNGWRLASCNLHGSSFISLLGFIKQHDKKSDKYAMLGVTYNGSGLTTSDLNNLVIE